MARINWNDQKYRPIQSRTEEHQDSSHENHSSGGTRTTVLGKNTKIKNTNSNSRPTKISYPKGVKGDFLNRFQTCYSVFRGTSYRPIGPDLGAIKSTPQDDIETFLKIDDYYTTQGKPGLFQRWLDPNTIGWRDEWAATHTDLGPAILLKPDVYRRFMDQFKAVVSKMNKEANG